MLNNVAPLWLWVAKSVHRFQDARAWSFMCARARVDGTAMFYWVPSC
jgi:hypothetical protein